MIYNGPYLRVLTPRTSNGTNVLLDENDRADYKEAHLPLTARPELESLNKSTPAHLRKKIEIVQGHTEAAKVNTEAAQKLEQATAEIELLKKQLAAMQQPPATPTADQINEAKTLPENKAAKPVQTQKPSIPSIPTAKTD